MSKPITATELFLISEIGWQQNLCHIDPQFLTAPFLYLRTWISMFSNWNTFATIHSECLDNWDNIPHAAKFPEEFEPTNATETADAAS